MYHLRISSNKQKEDKEMGNNKFKKILALFTAFSITISGSCIPQTKAKAYDNTTDVNNTKQYIIIADSQYTYNAFLKGQLFCFFFC